MEAQGHSKANLGSYSSEGDLYFGPPKTELLILLINTYKLELNAMCALLGRAWAKE